MLPTKIWVLVLSRMALGLVMCLSIGSPSTEEGAAIAAASVGPDVLPRLVILVVVTLLDFVVLLSLAEMQADLRPFGLEGLHKQATAPEPCL